MVNSQKSVSLPPPSLYYIDYHNKEEKPETKYQTFAIFLPSELSHHIFGAIFENQNGGFIHFSCSENICSCLKRPYLPNI